MVTADLCRDVAVEAVRRGARANVHELWALLEHLSAADPELLVTVGSTPAEWWAWWSLCPTVIAVSNGPASGWPFIGGHLPQGVAVLDGDPLDRSTALRVADQVARRPVDVLVLSGEPTADQARTLFHLYAERVRSGGMVILHGIADPAGGMGHLWHDLDSDDRTELIGADYPDGYGIITIPRKVSSNG